MGHSVSTVLWQVSCSRHTPPQTVEFAPPPPLAIVGWAYGVPQLTNEARRRPTTSRSSHPPRPRVCGGGGGVAVHKVAGGLVGGEGGTNSMGTFVPPPPLFRESLERRYSVDNWTLFCIFMWRFLNFLEKGRVGCICWAEKSWCIYPRNIILGFCRHTSKKLTLGAQGVRGQGFSTHEAQGAGGWWRTGLLEDWCALGAGQREPPLGGPTNSAMQGTG